MITIVLVVALIATFSVSTVTHWSAQRRDREILTIVKCIDSMLRVWAENWAMDAVELQTRLHEVVKECRVEQRQGERRKGHKA